MAVIPSSPFVIEKKGRIGDFLFISTNCCYWDVLLFSQETFNNIVKGETAYRIKSAYNVDVVKN